DNKSNEFKKMPQAHDGAGVESARLSTMVRRRGEVRRWSTAEPSNIDRKHRWRVARYRRPLSSQPASRRVWADAGRADASAAGPSCSFGRPVVAARSSTAAASAALVRRVFGMPLGGKEVGCRS